MDIYWGTVGAEGISFSFAIFRQLTLEPARETIEEIICLAVLSSLPTLLISPHQLSSIKLIKRLGIWWEFAKLLTANIIPPVIKYSSSILSAQT